MLFLKALLNQIKFLPFPGERSAAVHRVDGIHYKVPYAMQLKREGETEGL